MSEAIPPKTVKGCPKSRRLLRHAEFDRVYKQGRRHFAAHLTVFYLFRETETKGPRIGFTVGKALGGAVQRNRIKRRVREAVRLNGLSSELAADVVINPKKSVMTTEFTILQGEVAKAFEVIERSAKKGNLS